MSSRRLTPQKEIPIITKNGAEIMNYFPRDEILVAPR